MNPQILQLLDQHDAITKQLRALLGTQVPLKVPSGFNEIIATFGKPGDESNIEVFDLPYPLLYEGQRVTRSRAHRLLVPVFKAVLTEIKSLGLDKAVKSYGGIYNFRAVRGSENYSTHSWGIAIDIEPAAYPLGSSKRLPQAVVDVFAKHGFTYGGDFPGRKDPQHFQYAKDY
jgi:hypothetical protein